MHIAEFVANKYYKDDTLEGIKRVETLLSHPGVYFAGVPDDGVVLIYMTLSDEGLELLKSKTSQSDFSSSFARELLQHPGHHVYVFRLIVEDHVPLLTLKKLRSRIMQKHNAVSFSWHDDHHDNPVVLHTYKG